MKHTNEIREIRKMLNTFKNNHRDQIDKVFDLEKIGYDKLYAAYHDYSKDTTPLGDGNLISRTGNNYLFEAFTHALSFETVRNNIINSHHLEPEQFKFYQGAHGITLFILIADVGDNCDLIKSDMHHLGYFVGNEHSFVDKNNYHWKTLQFEPYEEYDSTEEIISENQKLYHWTPSENVASIETQGLIPKSENKYFKYPNRVYLILSNVDTKQLIEIGMTMRKTRENGDKYTLLSVDTSKLPKDIHLFHDPNADYGVFTEDGIPPTCIHSLGEYNF